jgi:hypothetical protein
VTSETTSSINVTIQSFYTLVLNSPRNHFALNVSGFLGFSPDFSVFYIRTLIIPTNLYIGGFRLLQVHQMFVGSDYDLSFKINSPIEIATDSLVFGVGSIELHSAGCLTTNSLGLSEGSKLAIKRLNSGVDSIEINVSFSMTSIPFVEIEDSNISNARVNMIYTGDASESFFVEGWAGLKVDVICGPNLSCESWIANWIAPGYPFVGERHKFEMICTEGTLNPRFKCYSIKNGESDGRNRTDSAGALMTTQAIIITVSCIVFIIPPLLWIIIIVRRWRKREQFNSVMNVSQSLNSELFLVQFDQSQLLPE